MKILNLYLFALALFASLLAPYNNTLSADTTCIQSTRHFSYHERLLKETAPIWQTNNNLAHKYYDITTSIGVGGTAIVWKGKARKKMNLPHSLPIQKNEEMLIKLGNNSIGSIMTKTEEKYINILAPLDPSGLFVRGKLDQHGALIMRYDTDFVEDLTQIDFISQQHYESIEKQLKSALLILEEANIVHSDLKPSNILYSLQGDGIKIKIIDFGLSAPHGGYPSKLVKSRGGTPKYMSANQLADGTAAFSDDRHAFLKIMKDLRGKIDDLPTDKLIDFEDLF